MADLPSAARVVIVGGGVVGASVLYHLALRGVEAVLLEKNELTSGSTWHAAGNVPTFSTSYGLMAIQRYSTELYRALGDRVGYPINYHVTGSIRLGHSRARVMEFERVAQMGRHMGHPLEVIGLDEIRRRHPFVELHDIEGALWDPADGDIDPAQVTQALAKGARDLGAKVIRFCPVTGVRRDGLEWVVETAQGAIRCEKVVNAAGYRAAEVGAMFGRVVPMATMSHQYLLTEEIPALAAFTAEHGRKVPLLRDVDSSYYLRQEKAGLNLGPYERDCRAHWVSADDPMPEDFSFQLWPDDLNRIEWQIEDAMARVPLLAEAGISKVINGPIPYAPDGNPLLGPMPGVRDAYEACVFTFGIAQGGGAGKVIAEWIVDGAPAWDVWGCDPRRFGGWTDPDYCADKAREVYGHEYGMHFPRHVWPAGRDRRLSPVHDRVKAQGAVFAPYNGWERAFWFAEPGDDLSHDATQTWDRAGPWEPRIRAECEAVRDAAGLLDLPGFSRFRVQGPGAAAWLDAQIAGRLPSVGRLSLAYFPDDRGRIATEMSAMRFAEDEFLLITAATAHLHDLEWLTRTLPASVALTDETDAVDCLILTGPKARAILSGLTDGDLSRPWLTHQQAQVAGRRVTLARVSFAGELGWEIHCPVADAPLIYESVLEAGAPHGLKPFGMAALDSLRIEKGYRAWKGDLSTDYTLLEGGLGRFVTLDKAADFPGKAALAAQAADGVKKRFAPMIVDAGACDAPYMASVFEGDEIVGEVTSGAWGYRVGASIALAMLRADCAAPGTALEVAIYGERRPATVRPDRPLWDPENERLRA